MKTTTYRVQMALTLSWIKFMVAMHTNYYRNKQKNKFVKA